MPSLDGSMELSTQQPLSDCMGWTHYSYNFNLLKTLHTQFLSDMVQCTVSSIIHTHTMNNCQLNIHVHTTHECARTHANTHTHTCTYAHTHAHTYTQHKQYSIIHHTTHMYTLGHAMYVLFYECTHLQSVT